MKTLKESSKQRFLKIVTSLFTLTMLLVLTTTTVEAKSTSLKLNKKYATIYVGKSVTLKIKGNTKKVTWTSNKKNIASVNKSGKVTGKKKGTAKITAKIGSKKLTCKVTVKNPYLNKTKLSLESGKTYTLKLKGSNVKKWSSSNNSIATVSSKGKVTAKKDGKATITCLAKNNKKYKCTVTVQGNKIINTPTPKPSNTVTPKPSNTVTPTHTVTPTPTNTPTPTHTHNYKLVSSTAATCTTKGSNTYKCRSCESTYTESVAELNHSFIKTKKKPEECYSGYDIYACNRTNCTYSYKSYDNSYDKNYLPTTLRDWDFTIYKNERIINLGGYVGTSTDITVPGFMWIGDTSYQVAIGYNLKDAENVFARSSISNRINSIKLYDVKIYNGKFLFSNLSNLKTVRLNYLYLGDNVSLEYMFNGCKSLTSVDLSNVQVSKVKSMYKAFANCISLKKVTFPDSGSLFSGSTIEGLNMGYMFESCESLTELNLGNTIITNPSLGGTFLYCTSIKNLDLTNIQGQPSTLSGAFQGCFELENLSIPKLIAPSSPFYYLMLKDCNSLKNLYVSKPIYEILKANKSKIGHNLSGVTITIVE